MRELSGRWRRAPRRGAITVLGALLAILILGVAAFAIDIGQIVLVRTQLQVAADSAALASAALEGSASQKDLIGTAEQFAGYHSAGGKELKLNRADVVLGTWDFDTRRFDPSGGLGNAVQVTVRRDNTANGELRLFLGRVLGLDRGPLRAKAIAARADNFVGFRPPSSGKNLPILPFAMDEKACNTLLEGAGSDDWGWDPQTGQLLATPDGIPEVTLYPENTGAPGNFGTVDIGANAGTKTLRRQILDGITPEDLAYHGGKLELDGFGELQLNGAPGIRAGIKDALAAIKGQRRIVPVYRKVSGNGNNAKYTIVQFLGVRILEVGMTGNKKEKRLVVQPAPLVVRGGIPASGPDRTSHDIYSEVHLVR